MKKIVKNFAKLLAFCFLSLVVSQSHAFADAPPPTATTSSIIGVDDNPLSRVLCNVYKITTGNAGKTFCAFAIVAAGVGFFTGKLNWGLLIALVLGISAIFGAPKIISAITGTKGLECNNQSDVQGGGVNDKITSTTTPS
jgi:type IV secretory pathway VirB2 component (pilin)